MALIHVEREAVTSPTGTGGGLRRWIDNRATRRQAALCAQEDEAQAAAVVARFTAVMANIGMSHNTWSAAGVAGRAFPTVTSVVLGSSIRLNVRPLPGQLLGDFLEVAPRIARGLAVPRVRITDGNNGLIRIELVTVDPLGLEVALPTPLASVHEKVLLGRVDSGELLTVSLVDVAHLICQGATRSGKSRWTYSLLGQLAGCRDLVIAGSDITGILLRPFAGTRHADWQAVGAGDLEQHVTAFEDLATLMHQRHERIPPRADVLPVTDADPLILAVIEEYGVLVDMLGAHDTQNKGAKLQARFRAAVRSLLAGGAKVGFRVLLLTQRADASGPAGVGAFERGQASLRLSFRVDTWDAAKMLHPSISRDESETHAASPAGIALFSAPGISLARLRSPFIPDYGFYTDAVTTACPPTTEV